MIKPRSPANQKQNHRENLTRTLQLNARHKDTSKHEETRRTLGSHCDSVVALGLVPKKKQQALNY
jgi:hypothetical protein